MPDPLAPAREIALRLIAAHADEFRPDFSEWIADNFHVYREFERRANRLWAAGRTHYSARTVMEVVRFDTDVRERGDFKINNNYIPDCARLFAMLYRSKESLFEFRGRKGADHERSI